MELSELFKGEVAPQRTAALKSLAQALSKEDQVHVNFICTHNSRRSHYCEVLFRTAALFYDCEGVSTFSGGTEGTALFPEVAASFVRHGFTTASREDEELGQKVWKICHPQVEQVHESNWLFSKKYSDAPNPGEGYHAVMVCDSANEACPVVFGAKGRHPIMFVDPKRSDNTPQQSKIYDHTLAIIAGEMGFIARELKALQG